MTKKHTELTYTILFHIKKITFILSIQKIFVPLPHELTWTDLYCLQPQEKMLNRKDTTFPYIPGVYKSTPFVDSFSMYKSLILKNLGR